MGIHVVGEVKIRWDEGTFGASEVRLRCDPEGTSAGLGIPLTVETTGGDLRLFVWAGGLGIPLAEGVVLHLRPVGGRVEASLEVALRGSVGTTPVLRLDPAPLEGNPAWPEATFAGRLERGLAEALRPVPVGEVAARVFEAPPWERTGHDRDGIPSSRDGGPAGPDP